MDHEPTEDVVPSPRRPTMADVAVHLGVSRQLVSLALRNQPGASAETRERVLAAAAHLGYSPHLGARVLRQSESRQIGVIFAPLHATEPEIVEAIYPEAAAHGYHVVLSATTSTRSSTQAFEELLGYRCAALIVIGSDLGSRALAALARRAGVPLVSVGSGRRNRTYDVVHSAGDEGVGLAVRHLAELGHRSISYVNGSSMPPAELRLRGYLDATRALGLRPDVLEFVGDYTEECGAAAGRQLLAAAELPTAVVTCNDQAAAGLILTLSRAGVSVPEQVSVTGYDDSRFARLSAVDLTTVRQDARVMGERAVNAALRRISHPATRPRELVVEPELVVRSSTRTPNR